MKLAFIGLGTMGGAMAANLQAAGHEVQSFDLNGKGTRRSVREASEGAQVLFTSVPGPAEVEAVAKDVSAPVWFDLSTNSPSRLRELHRQMRGKGVQLLDAPVSGGASGAKTGKLAIWVGGDRATYDKHVAVLRAMGDQPFYVGPVGSATVAKLAHNIASFSIHAAMAEIFTLGVKAGVEPLALFRALRQGATGRKRTFDRLAEHFLVAKYDPASFSLRLAHKDATLALALAREVGVPMQIGELAHRELERAIERGWIDRDFRAAMTLQEERAGVDARVQADSLAEAMKE